MRKDAKKYANNGNGLIIANKIISQCTSDASNLFAAFISVMSEGTFKDLALDMLAFSILKNLTENQESYTELDDEAVVVSSLRNIAHFTGLFFQAFPHVDFEPIMTYILNRMKENQCNETAILSKMLHSMFGYKENFQNYR